MSKEKKFEFLWTFVLSSTNKKKINISLVIIIIYTNKTSFNYMLLNDLTYSLVFPKKTRKVAESQTARDCLCSAQGCDRSRVKDYLKHFISNNQTDWDEFIPFAMFSYNTHIHASTNYSPYELLFGHKPHLPSSITQQPTIQYSYDDYVKDVKNKLNIAQKIARDNLINSKHKSKTYYDKAVKSPNYKVDDLVYLRDKTQTVGLNKKLSANYISLL